MTPDVAARAVTTRVTRGVGVAGRVGNADQLGLTYRPELDGLRGIAVLAVMAVHFEVPWVPRGYLGVDVFFVLSGFLITSILAGSERSLGNFYLRRILRLLPAFALMLVIVGWTQPVVQVVVSAAYLENLSMGFGWLPISASLGHTWTLAAEWQFYLVWPAVLLFARRRWSLPTIGRAVFVLALVSAAWRALSWNENWIRVVMGPDTHADTLLLGAALALGVSVPFPRWGLALLAIPLSLATFAVGGILAMGLATTAIIQRPPKLLAWRPLVWIGRISYGLYLWHVPILNQQIWPIDRVGLLALTFVVAGLSYRYVEQPLLRLGRDRPKSDDDRPGHHAAEIVVDPRSRGEATAAGTASRALT